MAASRSTVLVRNRRILSGAYSVMNSAVVIDTGTARASATSAIWNVYDSTAAMPNDPPWSGSHCVSVKNEKPATRKASMPCTVRNVPMRAMTIKVVEPAEVATARYTRSPLLRSTRILIRLSLGSSVVGSASATRLNGPPGVATSS